MSRSCQVIVDNAALEANFRFLKSKAKSSKVMAVIKSDAYGHGILNAAKVLTEADAFAVTSLDEGILLRQNSISQPITLLSSFFGSTELPLVAQHDLHVVLHAPEQLALLSAWHGAPLSVWVKINVGMSRLGFAPEDLKSVIQTLQQNPKVTIVGIMGHLSDAFNTEASITRQQIEKFAQVTAEYPYPKSLANSAGLLAWPEAHFDWVRPGASLYGINPLQNTQTGFDLGLLPVMQFEASIMAIHRLKKGTPVGYGGRWKAPCDDTIIAIISCGYGDGYPRVAQDGTPVLIDQEIGYLAGCVSMDMIAVDITHLSKKPKVGDKVILWGKGLPSERVAEHCQTIAYELCCKAGRTTLRANQQIKTSEIVR